MTSEIKGVILHFVLTFLVCISIIILGIVGFENVFVIFICIFVAILAAFGTFITYLQHGFPHAFTISLILVVASVIFAVVYHNTTTGYIRGDYSEYECEICHKPADGGKHEELGSYYCEEHFDSVKNYKPTDDSTVKCKFCEKEFDKDSLDGWNIEEDNYCIDCEARLIGIADDFN